MMKKVLRISCLLVSIAMFMMVFAGCGGNDDGAAAPPAAAGDGAAAAAAAPAGGGHFSDVHIVFFPGGNEGCPFASVVFAGARAAEQDLGVRVDYMWSDWNPAVMIDQFRSAIAMNPTGIAIMGHPGDDAYAALVAEAKAAGIIVTSQNTDLPRLQAQWQSEGFGFAGKTMYATGIALGNEAVSRYNLQPGEIAIVWGLLAQEGRGERTRGVIHALEDHGLTVVYYEISDAVNADAAQGISVFVGMMAANPDARLFVADHGALTSAAYTYMTAAGLAADDLIYVGFDLSRGSVDAINTGFLNFVIDNQPFLQGYFPILQIALSATYGFSGLDIDTGASFVDANNVGPVSALVELGIR